MQLKSGIHKGKLTEVVLLAHPDWAEWMIQTYPETAVPDAFEFLITCFDERPFVMKCSRCAKTATRATARSGKAKRLKFWCDKCGPSGKGVKAKSTIIRTFKEALLHVNRTCNGRGISKRAIIRALASAKGLPDDFDDEDALEFFD